LEKIENQSKEIITQAKTDAERLLSETNAVIEKTIREIKEAQAEKEKTKETRKILDDFKQSIQEEAWYTEHGIRCTVHGEQNTVNGKRKMNVKKYLSPVTRHPSLPIPIGIGDIVRIKGQQTSGEVMEIKGKTVIVAFGALKTSSKLEYVEKVNNNQLKQKTARSSAMLSNSADTLSEKKLHFKPEIDIRGMRGEEALQAIIYYIDDAIQCNAGRVRILHGTGTGALRQIVRDYLKTVQGIKNFHDEHVQFGGTGITVVELE
jgi:DNA mismatch repair protein MutS2